MSLTILARRTTMMKLSLLRHQLSLSAALLKQRQLSRLLQQALLARLKQRELSPLLQQALLARTAWSWQPGQLGWTPCASAHREPRPCLLLRSQ